MIYDAYFITQTLHQQNTLLTDMHIVVIGELVAKQIDLVFHNGMPGWAFCSCSMPVAQGYARYAWQCAIRMKSNQLVHGLSDYWYFNHPIVDARKDRSHFHLAGKIANQFCPEWNAFLIIIRLHELALQLCHINAGWTFRLTGLARKAEVHDLFYFLFINDIG